MTKQIPLDVFEMKMRNAVTDDLKNKIALNPHTRDKACGPCPKCGGEDRFITWLNEGSSTCMHCKFTLYWEQVSKEKIQQLRREKYEAGIEARKNMSTCRDWMTYANHPQAAELWQREGFVLSLIEKYGLGYCPSCPVRPEVDSLTIPVFVDNVLVDIRHRLNDKHPAYQPKWQKYRSHIRDLIPTVYNAHLISADGDLVVVEGEKKAITLSQSIPTVCGLPGIEIVREFFTLLKNKKRGRVIWALDPDLVDMDARLSRFAKLTESFGLPSYRARFFIKPDDMYLEHGADSVIETINYALPVQS